MNMLHTLMSREMPSATTVARGLGWFSLGLGLAQWFMPRPIARSVGMRAAPLVQACGAREIVTGAGLLMSTRPAPWLWARAAGDVLDMALLAPHARAGAQRRGVAMAALAAVAVVALLDAGTARALTPRKPRPFTRDYSDRSGLPRPADEMRGSALEDFEMPHDMRAPEAMRPYTAM